MRTIAEIYETAVDMYGQKTDKGSIHSYLPVYEQMLSPYRNIQGYVLEIGVACGASIPLWHSTFENAKLIVELDSNIDQSCSAEIVGNFAQGFSRSKYIPNTDAYDLNTVQSMLDLTNGQGFDIIIDDGSHLPRDQVYVMVEYGKILRPGGLMVIEDVIGDDKVFFCLGNAPLSYKARIQVADMRAEKNRFDDVMFLITREE